MSVKGVQVSPEITDPLNKRFMNIMHILCQVSCRCNVIHSEHAESHFLQPKDSTCVIQWSMLWDRVSRNISSYQYMDHHMLKRSQSRDRLIFNMGIPIPGKTVFVLRRSPGVKVIIVFWISYPSLSLRMLSVKCCTFGENVFIEHCQHSASCCLISPPMENDYIAVTYFW